MKRRRRIKLLLWILLAALVGEFFNLRFHYTAETRTVAESGFAVDATSYRQLHVS